MNKEAIELLFGRLVTDQAFRRSVDAAPAATCMGAVLEASTRQSEAGLGLDEAFGVQLASCLDARIVRASLSSGAQRSRLTGNRVGDVLGRSIDGPRTRVSQQRARCERPPA